MNTIKLIVKSIIAVSTMAFLRYFYLKARCKNFKIVGNISNIHNSGENVYIKKLQLLGTGNVYKLRLSNRSVCLNTSVL